MQRATDIELLHAFSNGDDRAFELLVLRHGAAIKGYALRMLRNPEQAEEVYEETFLRVATRRGEWEERGTVRGFLFTIAHRLSLDILRRRKVARNAHSSVVQLTRQRQLAPNPEAAAALGQQAALLERAIGELSTEHREVLLMRAIHGLSAADTAAALSLTESQVHSQLSYARKRLRARVDELSQVTPRRAVAHGASR